MNEVLSYLLASYTSIVNKEDLEYITELKNEVKTNRLCYFSVLVDQPAFKLISYAFPIRFFSLLIFHISLSLIVESPNFICNYF